MSTEKASHRPEVACAKCGHGTTYVRRVADLNSGRLYDEYKCIECGELTVVPAPEDDQPAFD